MTTPRQSRFIRCALLLSVTHLIWATGCGGTFTAGSGENGGASGGTGTGGKTACAGDRACPAIGCAAGFVPEQKPGECCPTCVPGGAGGASAGGTTGSGGAGGCGVAACPAIDCGGSLVLLPGQCCPTCQPGAGGAGAAGAGGGGGCGFVGCPAYSCANHYHPETQPGQCCPTCVPDMDACAVGQNGYATLVGALLTQQGSESCAVDSDCTLLRGEASCGDVCTSTAVSVAAAATLSAKLKAYAASNCSTCTVKYPPCVAPPSPACVGGTCMTYRPL